VVGEVILKSIVATADGGNEKGERDCYQLVRIRFERKGEEDKEE